jgi:hypothetical protein
MAIVVEKRFGRAELIDAMLDPRKLLVLYNRAASEQNKIGETRLPLWSSRLLEGIEAPGK